ncbi:MAG: hypothetical protein IIT98_03540 [Kiritimatiellae bacterium]|nr:hypothetical protein [Kiritimatiellia bacterium]
MRKENGEATGFGAALSAVKSQYLVTRFQARRKHVGSGMGIQPVAEGSNPRFGRADNFTFRKKSFLQVIEDRAGRSPFDAGSPGKIFVIFRENDPERLTKRSGSFDQTFSNV